MTKIKCSNVVTSIYGNDQNLFIGNSQGFKKFLLILKKINQGTIKIVTMSSFNVLSEIPILKMKTANKERKNQIDYLKNINESDQENLSVVLLKASSLNLSIF